MSASFPKRLFSLIFLAVSGLAVFAGMGVLLSSAAGAPAAEPAAVAERPEMPAAPRVGVGEFFLAINSATDVGDALLTYKGIAEEGSIRIDVVIPQLDPEAAYAHVLEIVPAKKGFSLLGQQYRLTAVNKHRIRIVRG